MLFKILKTANLTWCFSAGVSINQQENILWYSNIDLCHQSSQHSPHNCTNRLIFGGFSDDVFWSMYCRFSLSAAKLCLNSFRTACWQIQKQLLGYLLPMNATKYASTFYNFIEQLPQISQIEIYKCVQITYHNFKEKQNRHLKRSLWMEGPAHSFTHIFIPCTACQRFGLYLARPQL